MTDTNRSIITREDLIKKFSHYFTISYKMTLENGLEEASVIEHLGTPKLNENLQWYRNEKEAYSVLYELFNRNYLPILDHHNNEIKKFNRLDYLLMSLNKSSKADKFKHHDSAYQSIVKFLNGNQAVVKFLNPTYNIFNYDAEIKASMLVYLVNLENPPEIKVSRTRIDKIIPIINGENIDIKFDVIQFEKSENEKYINLNKNSKNEYWEVNDSLLMFIDKEVANNFSIEKLMSYQTIYSEHQQLLNKQIHYVSDCFERN